jgi:hypothetical protein
LLFLGVVGFLIGASDNIVSKSALFDNYSTS